MTTKIQVMMWEEKDWRFFVTREDGEIVHESGRHASEEAAKAAASEQFPDLEFVRSVPQEYWPPLGEPITEEMSVAPESEMEES